MGLKKMTGRESLLKAAHESFAYDGFERVGVAQILERAQVQAPTLYHHFSDKEGLYMEWLTGAFHAIEGQLLPLTDPSIPLSSALQAVAAHLLRVDFDIRQAMHDGERLSRPESKERVLGCYLQAIYSPLYTILSRGQAKGELRSDPVRGLAEGFVAGTLALHSVFRGPEAASEAAAWWVNLFLNGAERRTA